LYKGGSPSNDLAQEIKVGIELYRHCKIGRFENERCARKIQQNRRRNIWL
jgi:hypothetical protein